MRSDARKNQEEILETARRLFRQFGVSKVSMNQIANAAGVGAGTLYRHYAHKSALCIALVYDSLATFVNESRAYLEETQRPAQEQFARVLKKYLEFRENQHELLMNIDVTSDAASGSYFYASDIYQSVIDIFMQIIKSGHPQMSEQACRFRADMLIAMLKSDAYEFQRYRRGLSQSEIISETMALMW
ncbi:TetR/AcrR family transcriptional regulator [Alloscardovia criceti]|uniref:TetR/AcrR family transcriptional regulator n=1 Tax=Alloscardovia criceti TaxID=356828 RepID=UPI0003714E1F|nr:TetR/AcrR family transcriptional regulator [Alloscardovia criceti]